MLYVKKISDFEDRKSYILEGSQETRYIVPDIQTKFQFQNFVIQQSSFYPSYVSFVRAGDFFCDLLYLIHPKYRVISRDHLYFLFKDWLKKQNHPTAQGNILKMLHTYLPMIHHPEGSSLYSQWSSSKSLDKKKIDGFHLAQKFFQELEKLKMIERSCVKYLLIDQNLKPYKTPLIVDLGFSLDKTETEVFNQLSRHIDVTLLTPYQFQSEVYQKSHKIYHQIIQGKSRDSFRIQSPSINQNKKPFQTRVFKTMLDEIQWVTYEIHQDLRQKFQPSDIAILSPDMEDYWPCMKNYLKKEGIPFQKESRIHLLSFPQIQKWFSSIDLLLNQVSFENLEDYLISNKKLDQYSSIQNKYQHCDRMEDLKEFELKQNSIENLWNLEEFLRWILDIWNPIIKKFPNKELDSKLQTLLSEMASNFYQIKLKKFQQKAWVEMLKNIVTGGEVGLKDKSMDGISCLNINSITSLNARKVYIIGINHQSCQTPSNSLLEEYEAENLSTELGFDCFPIDSQIKEYELAHLISFFKGEIVLSYSQNNFDQQIMEPSKIWLIENEKNNKKEETDVIPATVWKSKQINWIDPTKKEVAFNGPIQKHEIKKLSPSRLKDYHKCPFIFLSKNIFHLEDRPEKDLDLNPMDKGSLMHEIFKEIINQKISTDNEIKKMIQSIKLKYPLLEESTWDFYEDFFLKKSKQFIENHKTDQFNLPQIQTVGTEIPFSGHWNLKKNNFDSKGEILIQGRIDRVDIYQDQYLIIDYKASDSGSPVARYWISEKKDGNVDFQMPLYIQALEAGLIQNQKNLKVRGAVYLIYKNFKKKGFVLKGTDFEKLTHVSQQSKIDTEKRGEILKKVNKIIQKNIVSIQKGIFNPQPLKKSQCQDCHWRKICRAPHLY